MRRLPNTSFTLDMYYDPTRSPLHRVPKMSHSIPDRFQSVS